MKRFLGAILATIVGLSLGGSTRADDTEVKAILDKAIKALGGADKLTSALNSSWKVKGTMTFGENANDFNGEVTIQGLDRFRFTFEGEFNGNQFKAITVVNGDKGWRKFADNLMEMEADGLAGETRNLFLMVTPLTLVPLSGKGFKVETAVEEKVGDKAAVGIKVTEPDGKDFKLYFDKETGLPVKQVAKVVGFMGDEFTQERLYSDYKDFNGIKRPTKIVAKRDGDKFVDEEITEFKVREKVAPETFTEPK